MTDKYLALLFGAVFTVGLAACEKKPKNKSKTPTGTAEARDYSLPSDGFDTGDQGNPGNKPPTRQLRKPGLELAGAHILISYTGAQRAKPAVTRTKAEALAFAKKLAAELKKDPGKFEDQAKKHSNGPSAVRGGSLGKWTKGRMVPEFDAAILKMKIGQVSDPVETPFGFHVIKRIDPKTVPDRPRRMPRGRRR